MLTCISTDFDTPWARLNLTSPAILDTIALGCVLCTDCASCPHFVVEISWKYERKSKYRYSISLARIDRTGIGVGAIGDAAEPGQGAGCRPAPQLTASSTPLALTVSCCAIRLMTVCHQCAQGVRLRPFHGGQAAFPHAGRALFAKSAQETGEAASLAVLQDAEVVYVNHLPSQEAITVAPMLGVRRPVYVSAVGKAICAHLSSDDQEGLFDLIDWQPRRVRPSVIRAISASSWN